MLWHEHLKRSVKLLLVGGMHYSGLLALKRKAQMQDRALILMYHRVNPAGYGAPDYSPVGMSVTPAEFEMQMKFVRSRYEVVPLARIVAGLRGEAPFNANMCAVTFDDGWQDVYEFAFPILRKHAIPATIFLTSGFINGAQWFWEERAKYVLALIHQRRDSGRTTSDRQSIETRLAALDLGRLLELPNSHLAGFLNNKVRAMKALNAERRAEMLGSFEQLATQIAADAPRPFLSDAEIREMGKHGVLFGHHTVRHPILTELSATELSAELQIGKEQIANLSGSAPEDFAYPYGKFDERVRNQVEQDKFNSACTTRFGLVERDADPYALNRINMCSDIAAFEPLFAARILGF